MTDKEEHPQDNEVDMETSDTGVDTLPRLELLHRVATRLAGRPTETAIYDAVIHATYELFELRYAVVIVRSEERWATITSTPPDTTERRRQLPVTGSRIDAAVDRNETIVVEGGTDAADVDVPFGSGQALCTPIGEAGVLQLVTDDGFDEDDVRYAELLGWIVDARLDRLMLREEVDSREEQLYAFTDFQRDVLEQASHELRTPLTSILGYMEMLADEDVGSLTDEQKSLAQLVLRKATELDAALETLNSAFDGRIERVREEWDKRSELDQSDVLGSLDGPFLLIDINEEVSGLLVEQLHDIGYDVVIADDRSAAREAIRDDPPSVIVVDLLAKDGDGIGLAEEVCRNADYEEASIVALSIVRDESTGSPQLGVSAYLSEKPAVVLEATETLLDVNDEERIDVLMFDTTADEEAVVLPESWQVTVVTDLDKARTVHREREYDVGLVRTEGLSGATNGTDTVREGTRIFRERRGGRRLPVLLVDQSRTETEPRYTIGGRLFVQRPLNATDLASTLISTPVDSSHREGDATGSGVTDQ
ncbi:utilizing regulatory protein tutC [Natronococcus amylolyticus DSM 10524]|uniref:Utilizing regulatory protein tutC n=1 Tax=Natronococcus amylolyticus DSM 10524 TaxID=1227497 RepID=L9X4C9_9EURY|nr:histidine kinase dimerization/phospho-acceptor domain-containing protein [Natronococcus amylolyticus]ELY56540.1 utilizing regulatory protein tutC [Natronococcus amylolyticus DSM 10524]